ncbi:hypothetical protein B9Q11_00245 [Candidatus Marsarchaeota G2 archaeon ECH_B_SAG-F08]|uniref:Uncharacterized protein n=1 Tax=Candidatus Marsarchaeota G2 archaeon ECH_B_SAG-F08 TaxID=1978165 RepID=A0A2R6BNJ8_9ARCH|nr:MAG: hypothetical protein B9Q11_00245 [Candidatus Marsarchaeota G2 archaeon ECH_B_SAG-F08]
MPKLISIMALFLFMGVLYSLNVTSRWFLKNMLASGKFPHALPILLYLFFWNPTSQGRGFGSFINVVRFYNYP